VFLQRERTRVRGSQQRFASALPTFESSAPGLSNLYEKSLTDLNALRMRARRGAPDSELVAAGLPWFMAPFGRDTLISSFQALPLGDGLARAALHALGDLQARRAFPQPPPPVGVSRRVSDMRVCMSARSCSRPKGFTGQPYASPAVGEINATAQAQSTDGLIGRSRRSGAGGSGGSTLTGRDSTEGSHAAEVTAPAARCRRAS